MLLGIVFCVPRNGSDVPRNTGLVPRNILAPGKGPNVPGNAKTVPGNNVLPCDSGLPHSPSLLFLARALQTQRPLLPSPNLPLFDSRPEMASVQI